ncbi:hypothetical protein C8R43DRAFT_998473 [Mycena crocata]|nr:hypothetical protein C8R43DRAFT_998473 [Mycena crocata]
MHREYAPRRCHFFSSDGTPRGKGCPRSTATCNFVHPDDARWPDARIPNSPHFNRDRFNREDRRDDRSRSPVRRPARPRSRSRSYSQERHRRTSSRMSDSRMDVRTDYNYGRSSHASPPTLPHSFTAPDAPAKLSSPEEMKVMWEKILPLIADCVEARKAHQDSQQALIDFKRMLETPRYTTLQTPLDAARIASQREILERADEEKRNALTASLAILKDTNWWPVGPGGGDGDWAAEKYKELIQYAVQLNETANAMYAAYVKNASAPPAADLPTHDPTRPLKRRRVSNASASTAAPPPSVVPPVPGIDDAELEVLNDQLSGFEERIADLQNDMQALLEENEEDILAQIDARMEAFSLSPQNLGGAAGNAAQPELAQMEQQLKRTEKDVHDIGGVVAKLLSDSDVLQMRLEEKEKERAAGRAELDAMKQRLHAYEAARLQDEEQMRALTTALELFNQRASTPAPAPSGLPLDFILRAIDDPIRDAVQKAVRPIVDEMDRGLQECIVKQDKETYGHLWGQIALTLKVVDAVSRVSLTPDGGSGRAPLPESGRTG